MASGNGRLSTLAFSPTTLRHSREVRRGAGTGQGNRPRYNLVMPRSRSRRKIPVAFTDRWRPLRDTMVFERRYHRQLAMSLAEKRDLMRERGLVAVWMYAPGRRRRLLGESYGIPVRAVLAEDDDGEGDEDLLPFAKEGALYVYSTTVVRRYEGRGLGTILKAYVLGRAFEAGYRWVVGHAREGASVALNVRFGTELRQRHANWYGTGDAYRFYVLRLR
jgi:GNAT superfamily N-acetyltransferase